MVLFAALNEQNCPLANFLDLVIATDKPPVEKPLYDSTSADDQAGDEYASWLGVA